MEKLPSDVVTFVIAKNLSVEDIQNFSKTSKVYSEALKNPALWKMLLERDFSSYFPYLRYFKGHSEPRRLYQLFRNTKKEILDHEIFLDIIRKLKEIDPEMLEINLSKRSFTLHTLHKSYLETSLQDIYDFYNVSNSSSTDFTVKPWKNTTWKIELHHF